MAPTIVRYVSRGNCFMKELYSEPLWGTGGQSLLAFGLASLDLPVTRAPFPDPPHRHPPSGGSNPPPPPARDGSTRGRGMGGQGVGDRAANPPPPPPGCTSRPCVDAGYCPDPGPLTGNVRGRRCAAPIPPPPRARRPVFYRSGYRRQSKIRRSGPQGPHHRSPGGRRGGGEGLGTGLKRAPPPAQA